MKNTNFQNSQIFKLIYWDYDLSMGFTTVGSQTAVLVILVGIGIGIGWYWLVILVGTTILAWALQR